MIIVTGAAGFIGSVLVKKLNEKGHSDILLVDRLESDEKWRNLQNLEFTDYMHADDLFENDHSDIWESVTTVYHMGACSATTERNVDYLWENNVRYTQALIILAQKYNFPICYASSAATYGSGTQGYSDNHNEIKKLRPLNAYGYSKQYVDQWILNEKDVPDNWYGVKFFNVFGPNEYHKEDMRSLVHKAFGQINETGSVKLFKSHKEGFKDGQQLRDFVYVKDAADAVISLVENKCESGIYNIGTGKARSFYDLVNATFKAMDIKPNIEFIDMPLSIRDQYQYFTQADMSKFLSTVTDFKFHTVEEAVTDYVQSYLNNSENPFY
jgi:ADP-L-glycero-D-manno-heptose 6-epimerase